MRHLVKLLVLLGLVLIFADHALAQRSGSGTFSGPNLCSDVVGQISGATYCFDQTSGSLNVWNGSAWTVISGYVGTPTASLAPMAVSALGVGETGALPNSILINNTGSTSIYFGSPTAPEASIAALPGVSNDSLGLSAGVHYNGSNWISDATTQQTIGLGPNQIVMYIGGGQTIGAIASPNTPVAAFYNRTTATTPGFEGIALGGYGAATNSNAGKTSFSLGNGYITSTNWANLTLTGAALFDGTHWLADGGAGSGLSMFTFQQGQAAIAYAAAASQGTIITWSDSARWYLNESQIMHFANDQNNPVPTVSAGGTLSAGSRDAFGEIGTPAGSDRVTITFGTAFNGPAYCVLNGAGASRIWWQYARSSTQVVFACTMPGTGAPCAGPDDADYVCWAMY